MKRKLPKRHSDRVKYRKQFAKAGFLSVGILDGGTPVLMCGARVIENTYLVELRHERDQGIFRATIRTDVSAEFVYNKKVPGVRV